MAYGTNPFWAQFHHGLELILLTRRLQWPIVALSLSLCLGLLALVIGGRRRTWWLLGLAPVLALFAHRFATDPFAAFSILDPPQFVAADQASFLADSDCVVGISFNGEHYAYPFSVLYAYPVVVQSDREQRLLLLWSAYANRMLATTIDHSLKSRELEIVSMPANVLLVYNSRLGEFINGVTGRTMDGALPVGFETRIATCKTTWQAWRRLHPATQVLAPPAGAPSNLPASPVMPFYPMPPGTVAPATRVALIAATQPSATSAPPVAVYDAALGASPVNLDDGPLPLLLLRDPATGSLRGFVRQVKQDLVPTFRPHRFPKFPSATLTDSDSNSAWTSDGVAVDGPLKGERLSSADLDDQVYLDVIGPWYPGLVVLQPPPPANDLNATAPQPRSGRATR
jgi:hypothetical protein